MPDLFENDWSEKAIGLKNTFFFPYFLEQKFRNFMDGNSTELYAKLTLMLKR